MTINCRGKLIDLSTPKVMGILNLTPDSFYDGKRYDQENRVLQQVDRMLSEGATFIDIGAYSSRPGADFVSEDEEKKRLLPLLEEIVRSFPKALISVDTFRASIAQEAVIRGATFINDISGGHRDINMLPTIKALRVPYIMMHMRGDSQIMQQLTQYDHLIFEVVDYFVQQLAKARALGINDVIIDPGFGFAKTTTQNYLLLSKLDQLQLLEQPMLVGLSRKSMIYKTLDSIPAQALNGTTALHMLALQKGATILRVHDVKEAVECIQLVNSLTADST